MFGFSGWVLGFSGTRPITTFVKEKWPLKCNLSEAKAIKPSHENQHHKSKKVFKFNFLLTSQNTKLRKTWFGKNFIPKAYPVY